MGLGTELVESLTGYVARLFNLDRLASARA